MTVFEIRTQGPFGIVYAPTSDGGLRVVGGARIDGETVVLTKKYHAGTVRQPIGARLSTWTDIVEHREIRLPLAATDSIRVACEWWAA